MVWPKNFVDGPGVVFKGPRAHGDFIARIGNRFADGKAFQLRQFLRMFAQDPRDLKQDLRPSARREIAPALLERPLRPGHGGLHVARRRRGDFGQRFFRGGIDDGQRLVPSAAAQHLPSIKSFAGNCMWSS